MPTIQKTKQIFDFIRDAITLNGKAPTMREIGKQFNLSSSASIAGHLRKMENKGWIKRSRRWRGIQIVEQ